MNLIRSSISLLLVSIVVLSGLGILWWNHPPEALRASAGGGRLVLGVLIAAALAGLGFLWRPGDRTPSR